MGNFIQEKIRILQQKADRQTDTLASNMYEIVVRPSGEQVQTMFFLARRWAMQIWIRLQLLPSSSRLGTPDKTFAAH